MKQLYRFMHKCLTQNFTYKPYVLDIQYFISRVIRLGAWVLGRIGLLSYDRPVMQKMHAFFGFTPNHALGFVVRDIKTKADEGTTCLYSLAGWSSVEGKRIYI